MVKNYYDAENYKPTQSLGFLTRRTAKLMTGHLDALFAVQDVTFVQYSVMVNIREGLAVTASDICQKISHDTGALTRLIDQLEERGLLERERSEADRRRVEIRLTPAGDKKLEHLIRIVVDFWNDMLADFSKEEADIMTDILSRMTAKLAELPKAKAA